MKGQAAALLLVVFLATMLEGRTTEDNDTSSTTTSTSIKKSKPMKVDSLENVKPFVAPTNILLQQIRTLKEDVANEKMQEEVAKTIKAQAKRIRIDELSSDINLLSKKLNDSLEKSELRKIAEAEDMYSGDVDDEDDDDEENEDEDEDDEDDEDSSYYDDEYDNEQVLSKCPKHCGCSEMVPKHSVSSAVCTKLAESQVFGTSFTHLTVISANDVRLGPHALRTMGLQQLESIKFVDSKISEIDRTAFDMLADLSSINITRAGLQEIDPEIFKNNTVLDLVTISGNVFKQDRLKEFLLDAPRVTELDFSNNSLTRLPRSAFKKMADLVYICLKQNRLTSLDRDSFKYLSSLAELDLSDNLLSSFPPKFFETLSIETLKISGNLFKSLEFIKATDLTVLDASRNKIKVITTDLKGVSSLNQLYLHHNSITKISQNAFKDLQQLTHLDLSHNAITSFTEHHLRANNLLQILLMSNNPDLQSLPVFRTNSLESETYRIYRFECANCGLSYLEERTFEAMPGLNILNLARNKLTALPRGLFDSLGSLKELDLSDNYINRLENHMFLGARSLSQLSLAGNPLVSLQVTPFANCTDLLRLDVSRCVLERIWSEARQPMRNLRFLSVHGNRLKRVMVEELRAMPKLSGFDLSENPLLCDNDFDDAIDYLNKHGIIPKRTLESSADYGHNYEGVEHWKDLAIKVCPELTEGPPSRDFDINILEKSHPIIFDSPSIPSNTRKPVLEDEAGDDNILYNDKVEDTWTSTNQDEEYEDYNFNYDSWYSEMWPTVTFIFIAFILLILLVHFIVRASKGKSNGPVIRPPMILRQGFIDNKNCGLVYKPLEEELPTPHAPKRGSFYSSSTFHYDKIVPESV